MIRTVISALRVVRLQLGLIFFLGLIALLGTLHLIPDAEGLSLKLLAALDTWGLPFVFLLSLVENIAGINVYFPGSVAILTAMATTSGQMAKAFATWAAILIGGFLAQQANYLIGRYFSSAQSMKRKSGDSETASGGIRLTMIYFFTTFWHPHFAAVTSLLSGSRQMAYVRFLSTSSLVMVLWYAFWGILMYNAGSFLGTSHNMMPFVVVYVVLWGCYDLWRWRHRSD